MLYIILYCIVYQVAGVFKTLKTDDPSRGFHRDEIIRALAPQGIAPNVVMKMLDTLCNDGVLYTTLDENHFTHIEI